MDVLNRSFVGIRLPADIGQKLAEVQAVIRHKAGSDVCRWTPSGELQIPIMALGECTPYTLEQVQKIAGPLIRAMPPMTLSLEGLIGSPNNLQPRFAWLGVTGDTAGLAALRSQLEARLASILPNYAAKPFQPHVDIGRIKSESELLRTTLGRALKMANGQLGCVASWPVAAIELLRSTTTAAGPALVPIQSYSLLGS